jgi:hypothetical protein
MLKYPDLEHLYYRNIKQLNYALPKLKIGETWMVPLRVNKEMTEYTLLCTLNGHEVDKKHLHDIAKDRK